mgnify:CR=1 FL=1
MLRWWRIAWREYSHICAAARAPRAHLPAPDPQCVHPLACIRLPPRPHLGAQCGGRHGGQSQFHRWHGRPACSHLDQVVDLHWRPVRRARQRRDDPCSTPSVRRGPHGGQESVSPHAQRASPRRGKRSGAGAKGGRGPRRRRAAGGGQRHAQAAGGRRRAAGGRRQVARADGQNITLARTGIAGRPREADETAQFPVTPVERAQTAREGRFRRLCGHGAYSTSAASCPSPLRRARLRLACSSPRAFPLAPQLRQTMAGLVTTYAEVLGFGIGRPISLNFSEN